MINNYAIKFGAYVALGRIKCAAPPVDPTAAFKGPQGGNPYEASPPAQPPPAPEALAAAKGPGIGPTPKPTPFAMPSVGPDAGAPDFPGPKPPPSGPDVPGVSQNTPGATDLPGPAPIGPAPLEGREPPAAEPGLWDQLKPYLMGGEGQGWSQAGNSLMQGNMGDAWKQTPFAGKAGLIGAPALAALMALRGRKKKRPMEVEACAFGAKYAAFNFEKLRKEQGTGPGDGGPKRRGTTKPRAIGLKGSGCCKGSKGKTELVPMGSGCYPGCKKK